MATLRRPDLALHALMLALALGLTACAGPPDDRLRVIYDTDMGNDIDDALALAMLHTYADQGEIDLLAVTLTKDNEWASVYVDLVNTFYGHGDVPVGVVRGGKTPDAGPNPATRQFIRVVSEQRDDGVLRYPRGLPSGEDAPEATSLLRQVLAAQPDGSVVLVVVGFSTNIARLLDSAPDQHSPLPGRDLLARKVKLLSIMAGWFGPGSRDKNAGDVHKEYNVVIDIDSAHKVYEEWPTPIVASGFEIGLAIKYPATSIESDFDWAPHHPVAEGYRLYREMPYDRETWDLTAVLYAVEPEGGWFELSEPGTISVEANGITRFVPSPGGQHRHLLPSPDRIDAVRARLVELASARPQRQARLAK